jgi:putative oxidoreductase
MRDSDFGKFIFRITIAILLLFHGYAKIKYGLGFIESALQTNGLPTIISYLVYLGEIIAPILLIIGYKTRFAAFMIISTMIFAIYLVYPNDLISLSNTGGLKLELNFFYIFTCLALIFTGAGKYSFDRR